MWFNPHTFLQKQGGTPSKLTKASKVDESGGVGAGILDGLDALDTPDPRPTGDGGAVDGGNAGLISDGIVNTTPITWPGKLSRPFLVAIDGSTCCPACGQVGKIPHHLSLIFWQFWTREQLAALVEVMRPDERLSWLAKGLVRVEGAGGRRELREMGGRWDEVPK